MSVKIYYGPYEAHGVIRHRTQKLHGVLNRLDELEIEAEIIPTPFINVCTVSMRSKQIFRCDIRNLMFNIECINDPVAQRLVAAVEEARDGFYSDGNMPKFSLGGNDDKNSDEDPGSIQYLYIINDAHNEEMENEEVNENDENENGSDEISEKTFDEIIIIEEIGITSSSTEQDTFKTAEQQSQSHLEAGSRTRSSTEETIISVVLPEPLADDLSEHAENEEDPERSENEQDLERSENEQDLERSENEQDLERSENKEDPEYAENEDPEHSENKEDPEHSENKEDPEHAENEEDPEEINETHDT